MILLNGRALSMKKVIGTVLLGLMGYSSLSIAANMTQISRYASVENKPLASQINPLLTVQQIHFPQKVQTVGEAMIYWLQYSGFGLNAQNSQLEVMKTLMSKPLPQVVRNLGPVTVAEGLEVLAGKEVFSLKENLLTREVSFQLRPHFARAFAQSKGVRA